MRPPNPVAFSIGGIDIMWYGILISSGFLIAIIISMYRAEKHGLEKGDIIDFSIWMIPFSIIGARLYYVVFSWDEYRYNLLEVFNIRGGGLAIHGGLIAGFLTALVFTKVKRINVLELADVILPAVALAQSIGRWGNFMNSEAHGGPTSLPWAIEVGGQMVHPTFLYESLWCLLIFILLIAIDRKRQFRGQIGCLYGILYSAERFFVEYLRTDSLMIGPLKQAMVISAVTFLFCLALYIYLKNIKLKENRR